MESDESKHAENGNGSPSDEGDAIGNFSLQPSKVVARMPVERGARYYNMTHKRRGLALIFNHEEFEVANLRRRSGTAIDCDTLRKCLQKLGFEVHVYHDLPLKDVGAHITDVAKYDHSDCDCFAMVVLSHGERDILYAKDAAYKPESLWSPFAANTCPTLAGKPKLFVIQACQGDKLMPPVVLTNRTEVDGQPNSYKIPSQADFLIAYSTIPGYYSWRNTTRGSWFIQALCQELEENGHEEDLLHIMTFVSRRVAIDYESNTPDCVDMHEQKQIPCITSMLTRLVKFTPKGANSLANNAAASEELRIASRDKSRGSLSGIFHKSKTQNYRVNY